MKILRLAFIFLLFVSCQNENNPNRKEYLTDSSVEDVDALDTINLEELYKESEAFFQLQYGKMPYVGEPYFLDTLINDVRLQILLRANDQIVKRQRYPDVDPVTYLDTELIVNLVYRNKAIYSQKHFRKTDFAEFIYGEDIEKYSIDRFFFNESTTNATTIIVSICQPDTAMCYKIKVILNHDGRIELIDLEEYGN